MLFPGALLSHISLFSRLSANPLTRQPEEKFHGSGEGNTTGGQRVKCCEKKTASCRRPRGIIIDLTRSTSRL